MKMDWIGSTFGISGAILVIYDVRIATIIWIISNVAFIIWSIRRRTFSIALQNCVYLTINTITFFVRFNNP